MSIEKVSVSLDAALVAEARRRIGGRSTLSSYMNDALRQKLLSERLGEYLHALDDEYGPLTDEETEEAGRWWADVKAKL